mmetsp:Transcript_22592/g.10887  ORF Transcript_22592/g.10887 Transcript_22592/m.10887 type:complete len:109 (+) Transcript_22592:247-573(+)
MRGVGILMLIVGVGLFVLIFFFSAVIYTYFFSRGGRSSLSRSFYECGFRAIPDSRINIDIQFSALVLIFLIYDMEIVILVPLLMNLFYLPVVTVLIVLVIFFVLGVSY